MRFILTLMLAVIFLPNVSNASGSIKHGTYACTDWVVSYPWLGKQPGEAIEGTMPIATVTKGKVTLSRTLISQSKVVFTQLGKRDPSNKVYATWFADLSVDGWSRLPIIAIYLGKNRFAPGLCWNYDICITQILGWGGYDLTKCMRQ